MRFRRTVVIVEPTFRKSLEPLQNLPADAQLLSSYDHFFQTRGNLPVHLVALSQVLQHQGRNKESFNPTFSQQLCQRTSIPANPLIEQNQRMTCAQGRGHLLKGNIKAQGSELQHPPRG